MQPSGIVRTGWPAVERTCREKLGVRFDRWQDGAGRLILAERADGSLASTVGGVGMSLPRQVGKTYLLAGLIFGLCVNKPGLLVIWSAHHAKTHNETFLAMQAFAQRTRVAAYIDKVYTGSGDEEIRFHDGSRILFGARERGFGRGIPGVDILVMDEAQILSERAMDNMLATLNTSRFGLHLYVGTPPKPEDNSESFHRMRAEALSGEAEDMVWIECGADPDFTPTPPPAQMKRADWEQVEKANPSYPHRTPAQSILRLRKKLTPLSLLREGFGIWPPEDAGAVDGLDVVRWASVVDGEVAPADLSPVVFAVTMTPDRGTAMVCAAGQRRDGRTHVQVAAQGPGSYWVLNWLAARVEKVKPLTVVLDGLASSLEIPLKDREVPVETTTLGDRARAGAEFWDGFEAGTVTHSGQELLDDAVRTSERKFLSEGFVWTGPASAPLAGVTLAHHGLTTTPAPAKAPEPFVMFGS